MQSKNKIVGMFAIMPLLALAIFATQIENVSAQSSGSLDSKVVGEATIEANEPQFVLMYKIIDKVDIPNQPAIATVDVEITTPGNKGSIINVMYGDKIISSLSADVPGSSELTFPISGEESIFVIDTNQDGTNDNDIGGIVVATIR